MAVAIALAGVVCFAGGPAPSISTARFEAEHQQRIQWMRIRVASPSPGVYQDFRAILSDRPLSEEVIDAAKSAGAQIVLEPGAAAGMRDGIVVAPEPREPAPCCADPPGTTLTRKLRRRVEQAARQYPDEVFAAIGDAGWKKPDLAVEFRHHSRHVLAMHLDPQSIAASIGQGREYFAEDWLCDPSGFYFVADNNLGTFDIGDKVPLLDGTRLEANLPIRAKISVTRDGVEISSSEGTTLNIPIKQKGAYRVTASLNIGGRQVPWIVSNTIVAVDPPPMALPIGPMSPAVQVVRNITYIDGKPEDAHKHQLDLYLPKGKAHFPVMMFVHGGSWRTGDRNMYALLGNRFAKAGLGVAIPSYRLMPKNPHPAQIDDVAAAFAWVLENIERYGGNRSRLYLAGHSAGGHLVALLALDAGYQKKFHIPPGSIRGVISISGVYNVGRLPDFQNTDDDPSPIDHIHPESPPFLITYCQWDYLGLPKQARDFSTALKAAFTPVKLVYIPGQGHISEIVATLKEDDPLARAILQFIQ